MPRTYWKDLYHVLVPRCEAAERTVETLKAAIRYQSEEAQKVIEREKHIGWIETVNKQQAKEIRKLISDRLDLINAMRNMRRDLKRAKTALSIIAGNQTEKDMAKMILDEMSAEEKNRKAKK